MKLIFKHSPYCPISAMAKEEVEKFLNESGYHPTYEFIDVIHERKKSQQVESTYRVKHESPQVLLISEKGEVLWHASHYAITYQALKKQWEI